MTATRPHSPGRSPRSFLPRGALIVISISISLLAALPARSEAANRRIALGNYVWNDPVPSIDLGEKVTWYWVGPDTGHSVTLASGPVPSIDSDLGQSIPVHPAGFTFTHTFSSAGTYRFICKIHGNLPGGTVTVSDDPGDPDAPPVDPVPTITVDSSPPVIADLYLSPSSFRLGKGSELTLTLNERASVQADIWRFKKVRKRFVLDKQVGWQDFQAHIGFNYLDFGLASENFEPAVGRYRAFFYVEDASGNEAPMRSLDFKISR